jgi:hypothetical protein
MSLRRRTHNEQEADALATDWVGKRGLQALLQKLLLDAAKLADPELNRIATSELEARIQNLI